MKYIVDVDALKECLTLMDSFSFNGNKAVYLCHVTRFIDSFPKEAVKEKATDTGD